MAKYVLARLREPGTMRSLAVVLFALLGLTPDNAVLGGVIQMSILLLGGVSAALPETPKLPTAIAGELLPMAPMAIQTDPGFVDALADRLFERMGPAANAWAAATGHVGAGRQ